MSNFAVGTEAFANVREIAFGRYRIRLAKRKLLVDGRAVRLGGRAFDLLLALIERRDRTASKNELLDVVWPGLVVEENNLQAQISALRKLLGPDVIVTIPGRGYRFAAELDEASSALPPLSIAILPFVTPVGDTAEQQLADAFTRDVASAFQRKMRSAQMASPNLAATDKPVDPSSLARELNVRYLVEGEIRRIGDQRVIEAKLIDAATATQMWSDRLQVEESPREQGWGTLAARLAVRLGNALWGAEVRRASAPPRPDASAMDLVLHAYAVWGRDDNTLNGALEARKWFDQALRLDGDSWPGLLGRVRTLDYELDLNPHAERDRILEEMDELTFRTVGIEPDSPTAWHWRAVAQWRQWRWGAALEAIAKVEKLDPSTEWPLNNRAGIMIFTGQPATALALVDRQLARDPQAKESLGWAALQRCRAYMALGRYDEAITACEKQIALDNWWLSHAYLLAGYAQTAQTSKTTTEKAALLKLRPGFSIADFKAQRFSDNPAFWQQTETHLFAGLRKAGIPEK